MPGSGKISFSLNINMQVRGDCALLRVVCVCVCVSITQHETQSSSEIKETDVRFQFESNVLMHCWEHLARK